MAGRPCAQHLSLKEAHGAGSFGSNARVLWRLVLQLLGHALVLEMLTCKAQGVGFNMSPSFDCSRRALSSTGGIHSRRWSCWRPAAALPTS